MVVWQNGLYTLGPAAGWCGGNQSLWHNVYTTAITTQQLYANRDMEQPTQQSLTSPTILSNISHNLGYYYIYATIQLPVPVSVGSGFILKAGSGNSEINPQHR